MRPQAGVDRLKPVPPMQANDLPLVAQAVSPANYILSQLLREGLPAEAQYHSQSTTVVRQQMVRPMYSRPNHRARLPRRRPCRRSLKNAGTNTGIAGGTPALRCSRYGALPPYISRRPSMAFDI